MYNHAFSVFNSARASIVLFLAYAVTFCSVCQCKPLAAQEANKAQAEPWTELFNGKDLDNWTRRNGTANYEIVEDTIRGTTKEGSPNSFLCTKKTYGDFELVFDVKVDNKLNSGVQIRSKAKGTNKNGRVFGPQVEIEASGKNGAEAGYVYGEATGRGWLTSKDRLKPHKHFKDGKWNSYRIVANGPRIQTWINDQPIADLRDKPIYETHSSGFIGLQVHSIPKGTGPYTVQWRNIKIRELKQ